MTKTLNQIIFFFLQQNQNIFFSNIGNQNIFLEKKHNPPLQVKWSVPYSPLSIVKLYIMDKSSVPLRSGPQQPLVFPKVQLNLDLLISKGTLDLSMIYSLTILSGP
jgi:hypothetical protein